MNYFLVVYCNHFNTFKSNLLFVKLIKFYQVRSFLIVDTIFLFCMAGKLKTYKKYYEKTKFTSKRRLRSHCNDYKLPIFKTKPALQTS